MARKTDEELKQELQALQRKFDENIQEQRGNSRKKVYCEIIEKECKFCGKVFATTEQRRKYCSNACKTRFYRRKLAT